MQYIVFSTNDWPKEKLADLWDKLTDVIHAKEDSLNINYDHGQQLFHNVNDFVDYARLQDG